MKRQTTIGVVLIVIGVAGLLVIGAVGWGRGYVPGYGSGYGPGWRWHRGPMMRGFGRYPMPGPWSGPGRGPGARGQVLPPMAGAKTVDIVATDLSCTPAEVSVKADEALNLRLVNQGAAVHVLVVPGRGIRLVAQAGQSVTTGFPSDQPGEYVFSCRIPGNPEARTIGKIVVTP